jgi:hypothetical protein
MASLPTEVQQQIWVSLKGLKPTEQSHSFVLGAARVHYGAKSPRGLVQEWNGLPLKTGEAAAAIQNILGGHRSEIEASGLVEFFERRWGAVESAETAPAAEAAPVAEAETAESEAEAAPAADADAVAAPRFEFTRAQTWAKDPDSGEIYHPLAAKRIVRGPDGSIVTIPYDNACLFGFSQISVETPEELAAVFRDDLLAAPDTFLLAGATAPGLDTSVPQRRLSAEGRGADRTIIPASRFSLVLDIDDAPVPDGMGAPDRLRDAAIHVRSLLPGEFHDVKMVAVATAGTGRKGTGTARLRLVVLLEKPISAGDAYAYLMGLRATLPFIDPHTALPGQPIYTARPIFEGMDDPVPRDAAVYVLPGSRDCASLDFARAEGRGKRPGAARAVADRGIRARKHDDTIKRKHGNDWRGYLAEALGGDLGFFEPLTAALGLAARGAEGDDAIVAHVLWEIGEKADPARVAHYNESWLRQALRSFRAKDEARRAAKANANAAAAVGSVEGDIAEMIENRRVHGAREIFAFSVPRDTATAQNAAAALAKVNAGVLFRGTAGEVVRVAVEAPDEAQAEAQAEALAAAGIAAGAGELRAVAPDDAWIRRLLGQEVLTVWPKYLDEGEMARLANHDGGLVSWSSMDIKGKMVDHTGWTHEHVCENAFNPQNAPASAPNVVMVARPLDAGLEKIAVSALRAGNLDGVNLRRLGGVSAAPVLLPDGTPCLADGVYHAAGADFYVMGGGFTAAAAAAFQDMALEEAAEVYASVVDLFPWKAVGDRAAAAAHLLGHQATAVFGKAPISLISSPTPGWGKSFFAILAPKLTTGRGGYLTAVGDHRREGEFEKRFESALAAREGRSLIFDEAAGAIPNSPLLKTATSADTGVLDVREFGKNGRGATMSLRIDDGLMIAFTGLNIHPSADMVRRTYMLQLDRDAAADRGWTQDGAETRIRQLTGEPRERARFVAAGLKLLSANFETPLAGARLPVIGDQANYRNWASYVRDVASFVTGGDALASQAEMRSADPKAQTHMAVARAIYVLSEGGKTSPRVIAESVVPGATRFGSQVFAAPADASFDAWIKAGARKDAKDDILGEFDYATVPGFANALGAWARQWHGARSIADEAGYAYTISYQNEAGQRRAVLRVIRAKV